MLDVLRDFDYRIFKIFNGLAGKSVAWDAAFVALSEYVMFLMIAGLAVFVILGKTTFSPRARSDTERYVSGRTLAPFPFGAARSGPTRPELAALQALVAAFIGRAIIVSLLRIFFFRIRPFVEGTVLQLVGHNPFEGSFPSGHTTIMFSLAFSLLFVNKRWGFFYLFLAIVSSLARIVVGVHYPFDIFGGIVVAAISAFAAKKLFDFWMMTRRRRKEGVSR